jgi:hydrogenase expression/formation protein HypC
MRIVSIDNFIARCATRGVSRDVSLFLIGPENVAAGDYVLVHVGYAIQTISRSDAAASWELFDIINLEQDRLHA